MTPKNLEHRKETLRENALKNKFGITLDEYNKMFNEQDGKCAICGRKQDEFENSFAVDHNHDTGKIRGLLCVNCNHLLGNAKDNPIIIQKVIDYLLSWNSNLLQ